MLSDRHKVPASRLVWSVFLPPQRTRESVKINGTFGELDMPRVGTPLEGVAGAPARGLGRSVVGVRSLWSKGWCVVSGVRQRV